jgi:single-strand DNA-binding protein
MILSDTQLSALSAAQNADAKNAGDAGKRRSWRPMVNKVILVGNLGRDPEVRSLPSGQPVASFSIATSRRWKDRDGNRQEQTEWHNIVCFGKQAEIAGQYLTKGKQIFVEGRIQTRSWDDKTSGEKKYRTEIICDNFQMLGSAGGSRGGGGGQGTPEYDEHSYGGGGGQAGGAAGGEDDDIPF